MMYSNNKGCGTHESQNYNGLYRMQAEKLWHYQEQEKRSGQVGNEQILQVLSQAHSTQGNQIISLAAADVPIKIEQYRAYSD